MFSKQKFSDKFKYSNTKQKMKFSKQDFFSKCNQICFTKWIQGVDGF